MFSRTGFSLEGEVTVCGNILKLEGSEGMLPQENFLIYDLQDCFWWLLRPHIRQKIVFLQVFLW